MNRVDLIRATAYAISIDHPVPLDVPPIGEGKTNLGWTADKEWLAYKAGIIAIAATASSRPTYYKVNNGKCIISYMYHCSTEFGGNWCFIAIISTDVEYCRIAVANDPSSYWTSYQYLGLTWYVWHKGQNSSWGGATELITDYPGMDMTGIYYPINANMTQEVFEMIMTAANVHLTREDENTTGVVYTPELAADDWEDPEIRECSMLALVRPHFYIIST